MKALVLAGGFPQIALIKELSSRGIVTVLADYFENPVAKPYADIFYRVSTLDTEAITSIAKAQKVDFLITACTDQALLSVAKVSKELNLPCYIDYDTALNVTNKQYMKNIFKKENISTANFKILKEFCQDEIKDLRFPLIVKPVDCNSSKGVIKVENIAEAKNAFNNAVKLSRTDTAIIEEYIEGTELSVDVYVEGGVAKVLLVSQLDKIPTEDKFVIYRSKTPQNLSETIKEQIRKTAQQIADAFNIKNAPMLIQMISNGEKVFVLEFSARTGGGAKYLMIEKMSGFDVIKAVVDLTLGEFPKVEQKNIKNKFFATEFFYCHKGIYDHLENFDVLEKQGVISNYYCFKSKGSEFTTIENSGDRIAGFSIFTNTKEDLIKRHKTAFNGLKVINSCGEDMIYRELSQPLYPESLTRKKEGL